MINISPASIIKQAAPTASMYLILLENEGADLLLFLGPQRALPGLPDDADVLLPGGVAVGLDDVR